MNTFVTAFSLLLNYFYRIISQERDEGDKGKNNLYSYTVKLFPQTIT